MSPSTSSTRSSRLVRSLQQTDPELPIERQNRMGVSSSGNEQSGGGPPSSVVVNGYKAVYSCEEYVDASTNRLQVDYDYEFVIDDPREPSLAEVLYEDVPKMEWSTLFLVSSEIGLLSCDLSGQNIADYSRGGGDLRRRRLQGNSQMEKDPSYIVALESLPVDKQDFSVDGKCEFLHDVPAGKICVPMHGGMTAVYTGQDRQAVHDYLMTVLGDEINNQQALNPAVHSILYLGDRQAYRQAITRQVASDSSSGDGDNQIALAAAISVSAVLLVVLFALVGLVMRRRRGKSHDSDSSTRPLEEVAIKKTQSGSSCSDIGCGPVDVDAVSDAEIASHGDKSHLSNAATVLASNVQDRAFSLGNGTASTDSDDVFAHVEDEMDDFVDEDGEDGEDADSDAPAIRPESPLDMGAIKPEEQLANEAAVVMLPPLAPSSGNSAESGQKRQSITMRKQRRRKRKKKRKMTRVNSRDHIHQMDKIQEATENEKSSDDAEQDNDSADEYYSTDDDSRSTASGRRSRDVSPAPSLTGSLGSASGEQKAPSPIQEEKTIRPLPPPWV